MTREERVALEAYRGLSGATEAGRATVLRVSEAPDSPMLNRIVGLGLEEPATEEDVDDALAAMGGGVTFYVAVAPAAEPAELSGWLGMRGLRPAWGWMAFRRGVEEPPEARTSLQVVEVSDARSAAEFGRVVRVSYGLPEAVEPRFARAPDAGWRCWLALDGDEPAAAAALYASGGIAYLSLAGTLPEHRQKGAQGALLAARIRQAKRLGCDLVVTETGERRRDRPSNSYRNILRAGFEEVAVTSNWLGNAPGADQSASVV